MCISLHKLCCKFLLFVEISAVLQKSDVDIILIFYCVLIRPTSVAQNKIYFIYLVGFSTGIFMSQVFEVKKITT
jgi:hypothetical protein